MISAREAKRILVWNDVVDVEDVKINGGFRVHFISNENWDDYRVKCYKEIAFIIILAFKVKFKKVLLRSADW